jgi:hypothetical protein
VIDGPMYDFNLLVSRSHGGYQRARREILAILKALGDEEPTVSRTLVKGLIGVKTSLAPRDVIRGLRGLQERDPLRVQYTCKWLPVDAWGSSDVEAMKDAIRGLRDRIEPTDTWRMTLEKRQYTQTSPARAHPDPGGADRREGRSDPPGQDSPGGYSGAARGDVRAQARRHLLHPGDSCMSATGRHPRPRRVQIMRTGSALFIV